MTIEELKKELKLLVPKGLRKTFDKLDKYLLSSSYYFNDFISLKAQMNSLDEQIYSGTITDGNARVALGNLNRGVIYFIDQLEEEDVDPKALKGEVDIAEQRKALTEKEIKNLIEVEQTLVEKINFIRKELTTQVDALVKFKYEKDLAEAEKELLKIREKLDGIQ